MSWPRPFRAVGLVGEDLLGEDLLREDLLGLSTAASTCSSPAHSFGEGGPWAADKVPG